MWVFLPDAHLSIVQEDPESRLLLVSARIRGDIEHVFPEADVAEDETADFRFCTHIFRERVASAIALRLQNLDYADLVQRVADPDDERREAYTSVWARMAEEQTRLYPQEEEPLPPISLRIDLETA